MQNKQFLEYILDLLSQFGSFTSRAMFGGYGIYKDGIIIAVIVEDELYFKGDKETQEYYESFGSEPFSYDSNGKKVQMSYWKTPIDVLEEEDILRQWIGLAYQASVKTKRKTGK
jgi:DNA transformation protein